MTPVRIHLPTGRSETPFADLERRVLFAVNVGLVEEQQPDVRLVHAKIVQEGLNPITGNPLVRWRLVVLDRRRRRVDWLWTIDPRDGNVEETVYDILSYLNPF